MIKHRYIRYYSYNNELRCTSYWTSYAAASASQSEYDVAFTDYLDTFDARAAEVPHLCIKNLYGSDTWYGNKPWIGHD